VVVADFLIMMEVQAVQAQAVHVTDLMANKTAVQLLNLVNQEIQVLTDLEIAVVTVHMIVTHLTEHKVAQVVVQVVQALNQVKIQTLPAVQEKHIQFQVHLFIMQVAVVMVVTKMSVNLAQAEMVVAVVLYQMVLAQVILMLLEQQIVAVAAEEDPTAKVVKAVLE